MSTSSGVSVRSRHALCLWLPFLMGGMLGMTDSCEWLSVLPLPHNESDLRRLCDQRRAKERPSYVGPCEGCSCFFNVVAKVLV